MLYCCTQMIFVSSEAEIFGALVTNGVLAAGKRVREQA